MLTADDFRRIALAMPDACEGAHMGHPDFRANGRIFASLHTRDQWGMVKLTPPQQALVMRKSAAFVPASGAWGRQGCTNVRLADAERAALMAAMQDAWQNAMALPVPKSAGRRVARKPARKTP